MTSTSYIFAFLTRW